jgi:hypothetical protein
MLNTLILRDEQVRALETILDYGWSSELKDFQEHYGEEDHVFKCFVILQNALDGEKKTPQDYL